MQRRSFCKLGGTVSSLGFVAGPLTANASESHIPENQNIYLNSCNSFYVKKADGIQDIITLDQPLYHAQNVTAEAPHIDKDFFVYVPANDKKLESPHILFFEVNEFQNRLIITKKEQDEVYSAGILDLNQPENLYADNDSFYYGEPLSFLGYLFNTNPEKYECLFLLENSQSFLQVALLKNENKFITQWTCEKNTLGFSTADLKRVSSFSFVTQIGNEKKNIFATNTEQNGYLFYEMTPTGLESFYQLPNHQILNSISGQSQWDVKGCSWLDDTQKFFMPGDVYLGCLTSLCQDNSGKKVLKDFFIFETAGGDITLLDPFDADSNTYLSLKELYGTCEIMDFVGWHFSGIITHEKGNQSLFLRDACGLYLGTLTPENKKPFSIQEIFVTPLLDERLKQNKKVSFYSSDSWSLEESGQRTHIITIQTDADSFTAELKLQKNRPVLDVSEENRIKMFRRDFSDVAAVNQNVDLVIFAKSFHQQFLHQDPVSKNWKGEHQLFIPRLLREETMLQMWHGDKGGDAPAPQVPPNFGPSDDTCSWPEVVSETGSEIPEGWVVLEKEDDPDRLTPDPENPGSAITVREKQEKLDRRAAEEDARIAEYEKIDDIIKRETERKERYKQQQEEFLKAQMEFWVEMAVEQDKISKHLLEELNEIASKGYKVVQSHLFRHNLVSSLQKQGLVQTRSVEYRNYLYSLQSIRYANSHVQLILKRYQESVKENHPLSTMINIILDLYESDKNMEWYGVPPINLLQHQDHLCFILKTKDLEAGDRFFLVSLENCASFLPRNIELLTLQRGIKI